MRADSPPGGQSPGPLPTAADRRPEPLRPAPRARPHHRTFTAKRRSPSTVTEPIAEVWLNAAELAISEVAIARDGGPAHRRHGHARRGARALPPDLRATIAPGTWRLRLAFRGTLNDKLRGFYRSTYKDPSGATRTLAATQFEATDARRAFPCWDEPAFKAVFAVHAGHRPRADRGVQHRRSRGADRGRQEGRRFADTIPMSTYLVAFVVGELEATEPRDGRAARRCACGACRASGGWPRSGRRSARPPLALLRGVLRPALPGRQARSPGHPRLRRRAPWRTSAPSPSARPRCWWTSARPPTPSWSAWPTWSPTRTPTCGSATSSPWTGGTASG